MPYVKSNEIAHLWAHQSHESASCSASMSFEGAKFYSYGTVMAEIVTAPSGDKVFLVNEDKYSVTTSRHQGEVRAAIPRHARRFDVPGEDRWAGGRFSDPARILKAWERQTETILDEASRATMSKKKERLIAEAVSIVDRMRAFATFFAVTTDYPVIPGTAAELAQWTAQKDEREAAAKAKVEAERKAAEVIARKKAAPKRRAWIAGKSRDAYSWRNYYGVELRIVGDEVETSMGARFPVSHARRGLALVDAARAAKREWKRNGHTCHLGNYELDSIEPNGTVHAGCHVVTYKAIARIREQLTA